MYQQAERYSILARHLVDLQVVMQEIQLWNSEPPTSEQLASVQPFCVDTMSLEQWLRYVFMARCQILIDQQLPLPNRCDIAPMVEQDFYWKEPSDVKKLLESLERIDLHLSRSGALKW